MRLASLHQSLRMAAVSGLGIVLVLAGCGLPALSAPEPVVGRAPPATISFIHAYARGDFGGTDDRASPLYRVEWERRGLSPRDREALLPEYFKATPHPTEWVHFTYVGGLVDDRGFEHFLFTAASTGGDGDPAPTVWRVDADPEGRVIWNEMVYLFSDDTSVVKVVAGPARLRSIPAPSALRGSTARALTGVESTHGPEGYYAVAIDQATSDRGGPGVTHANVWFFAVDRDGYVRRGAWTYGEPQPGARRARAFRGELSPAQNRLLTTYLAAIQ